MRYILLLALLCTATISHAQTDIGLQFGPSVSTSSITTDEYEIEPTNGFALAFVAEHHFDKAQRKLHFSITGKMGVQQFESTEKYTLIDPYYPDSATYHQVNVTTKAAIIATGGALTYTIMRGKRVQMHTGLTALPMLELGNFANSTKLNLAIEAHYAVLFANHFSLGMRLSQPLDGYRANYDIGPRSIGNKYVITNILLDVRYRF